MQLGIRMAVLDPALDTAMDTALDLRGVMTGDDPMAKEAEAAERKAHIVDSLISSLKALDMIDPEASKAFIDAIRSSP